ncbi:MAG: HD domain-containing protein [Cohnella sp.]|nr:HD domain-containing protein [Cohnella sp.]
MELLKRTHSATYFHCVRVALLAERAADALELGDSVKQNLVRGSFIHDLGKLMVPNGLLESDKPLTEEEWSIIKRHPEFGAEMIARNAEMNEDVIQLVLHHHERWDGNGYPSGLKGEQIPLLARICAVADAFDSMTSERTYRARRPVTDALRELERHAGTQFDGAIVECFLSLRDWRLR